MGRLTLNILLSFAQFEREIIGERIRDKKLLTARQGKYIGGQPKLGFDIVDRRYAVNETEAKLVKRIFKLATQQQSCLKIAETLNADPIWEVLYPEEQSRILELLIETVRVSENNVDMRFRTNGIEKIVEELTSQGERSNG